MYLLDTDVLSNLRKAKPHPRLLAWIAGVGWDEIATTAITVMEVQIGIERARRTDPAVAADVEAWLHGLLRAGHPAPLPLDAAAAVVLGRRRETPALKNFLVHGPRANTTKTGADLDVAAIAAATGAAVV